MQAIQRTWLSLILSSAPCVFLQAQDAEPTTTANLSADATPLASDPETSRKPLPVEVSGYFSLRQMRGEDSSRTGFLEYAGSLFLSRTYKRWNIHSELNVEHSPDFDGDGILFGPKNVGAHLHTAWINYAYRDWLNARGGVLHVPTYWRTHRYQSTTLTVEEPLIDLRVFPSAIIGGMIHGSSYFGESGLTYSLYSGGGLLGGRGFDNHSSLPNEESSAPEGVMTPESSIPELKNSRAMGGTFTYHFPSHQFFQHLDFGVHRLQISYAGGSRQSINGFDLEVEKKRLSFLGEYAHASVIGAEASQRLFREGYYLQPSWRIRPKLFGVYRFDSFGEGNRSESPSKVRRQTAGLTFRPIPTVSLKLEYVRHRFNNIDSEAHNGVSFGAVYYFLFR